MSMNDLIALLFLKYIQIFTSPQRLLPPCGPICHVILSFCLLYNRFFICVFVASLISTVLLFLFWVHLKCHPSVWDITHFYHVSSTRNLHAVSIFHLWLFFFIHITFISRYRSSHPRRFKLYKKVGPIHQLARIDTVFSYWTNSTYSWTIFIALHKSKELRRFVF